MEIALADWINFRDKLASMSDKASEEMLSWIESKGGYANINKDALIARAYALSTKYGEGAASLAAQMYDEVAALSKVTVPAAEVAETASYGEIAKAINGVTKKLTTDKNVSSVVGRYVKRTGADTTLKNARRDGAQFAWVPGGDACAFCATLASRGWQYMSASALKGGHAEHIHAHCMCTYMVRFDNNTKIKGYDPDKYKEMYDSADGSTPQQKINSMRRIQYQENKDKINAQKRANYAAKNKSLELYRKEKNTGVYKIYTELMSKKHVNSVVIEMGLNPGDVKYKIDRNKELIGSGYLGHTSDDGKVITLYPDAFKDREQLVKTIGHENTHLNQIRKNGKVKVHQELAIREKEAYASEQRWWDEYVKNTGYRHQN